MRYRLCVLIFLVASCDSKEMVSDTFFSSGELKTRKEFLSDDTTHFYITFYREDGTLICEGEKQGDKKQGKWTYYDGGNTLETIENFCNGLLCDTQKYFFPDGQIKLIKMLEQEIECFCDTPCLHSYSYVEYWENGNVKEKSYLHNCKFHNTTYLYDSLTGKATYEIDYMHGIKEGTFKRFYKDGSILKGEYRQGKQVGKWITVLGDSLISEENYEDE